MKIEMIKKPRFANKRNEMIWYAPFALAGLLPHILLVIHPSVSELMIGIVSLAVGIVASWHLLRHASFHWRCFFAFPLFSCYLLLVGFVLITTLSEPHWILHGWTLYLKTGQF